MPRSSERKFTATVKVMRSYDYCHFEATLGTSEPQTLDQIDDMRKHAAILVDEAVRQYKESKKKESKRQSKELEKDRALERIKQVEQLPSEEWSIEDAALMRSVADKSFWKDFYDDDYYYYDPEREHHFSMLRKFQGSRKTKVKV